MAHSFPTRRSSELNPQPLHDKYQQILKDAGYATACVGKWGMGMFNTSGSPLKLGFEHFFGYNCQLRAHEYYPDHLWRNDEIVPLDEVQIDPDNSPADWRTRSQGHRAAGQHRDALRCEYRALVGDLARRHLLDEIPEIGRAHV